MTQVAFLDRIGMGQPYERTNLKLDLENRATGNSRKRKFLGVGPSTALLQSPDLKLLKLGSPELEKLIINNNGFLPTPTPGGTMNVVQQGEQPAEDKESFARGFIEALQKLQEQDVWDPTSVIRSVESPSSKTSVISPPKWSSENRNTIGVTTPVITPVITNRFETQSPPISRIPSSSPSVLINFPTASSGSVSSMGLTAVPRSSTSFITCPATGDVSNTYTPQTNSQTIVTPGITLPMKVETSPLTIDHHVNIKSEDEAIVPSNSGAISESNLDMNPIDLDAQEHIKHQRKKLRNRLAAQRCRRRKIEREDTLKIKVKELKNKNAELTSLASTLRMQVCDLKQKVMHHVNEGCQVFLKDSDEEKQLLSKSM